jgi:hypothetical protein
MHFQAKGASYFLRKPIIPDPCATLKVGGKRRIFNILESAPIKAFASLWKQKTFPLSLSP